jgi:hypothetical protein
MLPFVEHRNISMCNVSLLACVRSRNLLTPMLMKSSVTQLQCLLPLLFHQPLADLYLDLYVAFVTVCAAATF